MNRYINAHAVTLVLERGEELIAQLNEYAKTHSVTGAWLQSGLGGADRAVLAFYDLETRRYIDQVFDEPLEILSLQGNLAWIDGEPFWHVHGTFSGRNFAAVGGHVKELSIGLTGELLITPLEVQMTRVFDDETGLKLMRKMAQ